MISKVCYDHMSPCKAFGYCFLFAIIYVGSLYVRSKNLPRDHPKTMRERMIRVAIASMFVCIIAYYSSSACINENGVSFCEWIGIRKNGFLSAIIFPLILTLILFLGPVSMFIIDYGLSNINFYKPSNIFFWRNYIVAPLSEECVFRGCMLPLLVPAFGTTTSIFLAPWFFSLAHIHHAYEQYKIGNSNLSNIAAATLFQTSYTTIFGILSSFFFLRTGHLISPFLSHALCNIMGFPDFEEALLHRKKYIICSCFVFGLILFFVLLWPLTEPSLYYNNVY